MCQILRKEAKKMKSPADLQCTSYGQRRKPVPWLVGKNTPVFVSEQDFLLRSLLFEDKPSRLAGRVRNSTRLFSLAGGARTALRSSTGRGRLGAAAAANERVSR